MNCAGVEAYNLGTVIGYSVLDVVHNFENQLENLHPIKGERRARELGMSYSDANKDLKKLG